MLLAGARALARPAAAGQRALCLRRRGGDRRALDRRIPRGRRAGRRRRDHLRLGHDRRGRPRVQHRHARAGLLPPRALDRRTDLHSGHLRRRRAQRRPRADPHARAAARRRRSPGRAAAPGNHRADRAGARGLEAAARRRRRARRARARNPADATAAEEFYIRTTAEPALDVNGIESGSPHLEKTVLPVRAVANVSVRLAPGQDPDTIADALRAAAARRRARRRRARADALVLGAAGIVPPDARAIQLGQDAFERVLGVRPGADPLRRHAADRRGAGGPGDPDDHLGLLAPRRADPRAQREHARPLHPAGHRHRQGAVRGSGSSSDWARRLRYYLSPRTVTIGECR